MRVPPISCHRGMLVSIEGISGVGKTYLTSQLKALLQQGGKSGELLIMEGFSKRTGPDSGGLGRDILRALIAAANGDRFLRGGYPSSETLLLLAIKMHDYEGSTEALKRGHLVIEGRSIHSTAVYQSLIIHSDDERALKEARGILELARQWRLPPDLTILITDDINISIDRVERRDGERCAPEHRAMHRRAAELFERLARDDPAHVLLLDRRTTDTEKAVRLMRAWIDEQRLLRCLIEPWRAGAGEVTCQDHCRLAP